MGGVPTRLVNDFLFYGFLLGAGVLFILGSSLYIPALRPASGGSSNNSGLQSIQDQLNRLSSSNSNKPLNINWVTAPPTATPKPSSRSRSTYKVPTPSKVPSNCSNAGGYTIWRGSGCNSGRSQSGLEYAILGTNKCSEARAAFLKRWACK